MGWWMAKTSLVFEWVRACFLPKPNDDILRLSAFCYDLIAYNHESVALLVARRTNNRKVVSSRPTKVVCITVLTGNRLGWTVRCGRPPLLLPSCRKLEFRLLVLMDSDLAWVNGKSGRQSWCYADALQRSIILGAITIYHFTGTYRNVSLFCCFVNWTLKADCRYCSKSVRNGKVGQRHV